MADIDFMSEGFFRDPGAAVAALRASGPAVSAHFPMVGKVWMSLTEQGSTPPPNYLDIILCDHLAAVQTLHAVVPS